MKNTNNNTMTEEQIQIIPTTDIPVMTDFGIYPKLSVSRTFWKGVEYLVCNLRTDEFNTYFEMWDEEGFIGNYMMLNTDMIKCFVKSFV